MNLIVVTDIFGRTTALKELLSSLPDSFDSIEIIDPYEGKKHNFRDEKDAYKYFTETVGLENYIKKLASNLENNKKNSSIIIGFSIGASAVWAVSETVKSNNIRKAICFYSSQIRNYTDIRPGFPVDIYFASEEPGYDVDEMIKKLSEKEMVKCFKTNYLHGFMNKNSHNFDLKGYFEYIETIKKY